MNRNDYRRALIMLRSLSGSASGYVRLERRTLAGTLQFTLNSAPTEGRLYAVLLCRKNGAWHAVKADAFGAPRYGQVGLVWSFDPRNIEGLTLEQYDMAAVAQVHGSECNLLLCGNLNGSVNADCSQLHTAVSRLFTPVRVSRPQSHEDSQLSSSAADSADASSACALPQKEVISVSEKAAPSSTGESAAEIIPLKENASALAVGEEIPAIDASDCEPPHDIPQDDTAFPFNEVSSSEKSSTALNSAAPAQAEGSKSAAYFIEEKISASEAERIDASSSSCGCIPSEAEDDSVKEQAVLSRSVYPAVKAEPVPLPDDVPVEADEFDTPAASPIESDDLDTPAQEPVEPDEFDTPAQTPVEPDELDSPALMPIEPDALDTPCSSDNAQAVLSRSVYPAVKAEPAPLPDDAPVEADEFDTPATTPIESDDLDTPAQEPVEPDEFDTPAQTPVEPDALDSPALTPIEPDALDTPCSFDNAQAVLSRSVYPAVKAEPAPLPDDVPVEADEFDTPAASPIESDELDTPAADSFDNTRLSTPAKRSSLEIPSAEMESYSEKNTDHDEQDSPLSAGQQLALSNPEAAWHTSIEPLHTLFFSQEAVVPFEAEGYIFIRAPLYGAEDASSCLVGLYCEDGIPSRVCYAIPADYTNEPPAGMEGYVWRGSRTRGYWVICEAVPAVE